VLLTGCARPLPPLTVSSHTTDATKTLVMEAKAAQQRQVDALRDKLLAHCTSDSDSCYDRVEAGIEKVLMPRMVLVYRALQTYDKAVDAVKAGNLCPAEDDACQTAQAQVATDADAEAVRILMQWRRTAPLPELRPSP
jgi:hypothetical protein